MNNRSKEQKESQYNPTSLEEKWQKVWEQTGIYEPDLTLRQAQGKPFYNLMMFPYPSAEGMHIGNMYAFTGADIYGRFKRMNGFDVFEPIGLDGFGIHSENYALKIDEHPKKVAARTEANFYRQLRASGNSYSWKHTLETYDPDYYKWTQWLFIQMFKAGLAYKAPAPVNFCPSCKTVLADEQVINGVCERCGTEVEVKKLNQWFFRITEYAERLLQNTYKLNWPEKVLIGQRNWIGKSEGAEIIFKVEGKDIAIKVFTTRLDTVYGVTAIVLAPDKMGADGKTPLAIEIATKEQKQIVEKYITDNRQQITNNKNEKTGVFTGAYAINPFSEERVPIWVANYIVGWYGTGALMVVPAHDERDFEFAKKYRLPVRPVIKVTNQARALVLKDSVSERFEAELRNLRLKITISEKGNYQIELTPAKIDRFISIVRKYLKHQFWVEIVGVRTIFIFGDGEQIEIKNLENEEKVFAKCKIMEESITGAFDLWDMLTDVSWYKEVVATTEYGVLVNSGEFSGLSSEEAIAKMTAYLEDTNQGKKQTQYKLRDWIISRQRYWGAPIPMIYCEKCAREGKSWFNTEEAVNKKYQISNIKYQKENELFIGWYPVNEQELPVLLPEVEDWQPKGTGRSPLAEVPEFVYTTCPNCGGPAERETDVCDTFLDSSWYFLRYPSVSQTQNSLAALAADGQAGGQAKLKTQNYNAKLKKDTDLPWNEEITRKWLPVSQYIGGVEHTVLHLLYSRFVTMALCDMGFLSFDEPFPNFYAHGLIIKEGAKMSKSKGNIVVPDSYIKKYGADALRCYLMFLGPFNEGGDFRDTGMAGMFKFMRRIWRLCSDPQKKGEITSKELKVALHKTIMKVTEDIPKFKYNTSLAALMEFANSWERKGSTLARVDMIAFLKLLAPFAPHISEEIYQRLEVSRVARVPQVPREEVPQREYSRDTRGTRDSRGTFSSIHQERWPQYDPNLLVEEEVTIVVQVNGKLRSQIRVPQEKSHDRDYIIEAALKEERVQKYLKERIQAKKIFFVPAKLINFVV